MKESKHLEDKTVVELLLAHNELTVPKMAELLEANPASVDYHLKGLIERNIVKVKKKKYGSKYSVNEKVISISGLYNWVFSITFIFWLIGLMSVSVNFFFAVFLLATSGFMGVCTLLMVISRQRKDKIKALLQTL